MIIRRIDGSVACCHDININRNDMEVLELAIGTMAHLVPRGAALTFSEWACAIKAQYAESNQKTAQVLMVLERLSSGTQTEEALLVSINQKDIDQFTDVDVARSLWLLKDRRKAIATLIWRARQDLRFVVEMLMREDFPQDGWFPPNN